MNLTLVQVCLYMHRFDRMVQALKSRHGGRPALEIEDEYDVQDLLFAGLKPLVIDLQKEDPTRKIATVSGRLDLVSHSLGLAIEVKALTKSGRERDIARECLGRVQQYSTMPGLKTLVFFLYDPQCLVPDVDGLQAGLEGEHLLADKSGSFTVYFVCQRVPTTFMREDKRPEVSLPKPRVVYSEADALALLRAWFDSLRYEEQIKAHKFAEVDALLGMHDGTTKQYLVRAIQEGWQHKGGGEQVARFEQRVTQPVGYDDDGGYRSGGHW